MILLKRNMIKLLANKSSSFMCINPATPFCVLSLKSDYFVFQYSFLRNKDEWNILMCYYWFFLVWGYIHV